MAWNGSDRKEVGGGRLKVEQRKNNFHSQPQPSTSIKRGALAGLIIIALGSAALWWFAQGTKHEAQGTNDTKHNSLIAEAQPNIPTNQVEEVVEDPKVAARKARLEKLKAMTPAERLEFLMEEMKNKPIDFTPTTNRVFATGTEQVMGWLFTTKLGDPPPPLPRLPLRDEAHLAEILIADNPVLETDSERAKQAKKIVEEVKKEAIQYLKEGGNIQDFLHYYHDQLRQAYHEYTDASKSAFELLKNGEDPDLCAEYVTKVNKKLAERGIEKKVVIPDKLYEKFAGRLPASTSSETETTQQPTNQEGNN